MATQFTRGRDPLITMDIGHIKDVEKWLAVHHIEAKCIDSKTENNKKVFLIDVDGDVFFEAFNIDDVCKIPKNIKFRNVTGRFILGNNK